MRILFLGDVVGRTGRSAITGRLPKLRAELNVDFIAVNCENATNGLGLSPAHARAILAAGADCITLGDHAFDQRDMIDYVAKEPRIVLPLNYAKKQPAPGARVFRAGGKKILVAVALGRVFMNRPFDDPFEPVSSILDKFRLGTAVDASIVEIHAEATSEKAAIGIWCDGRASLVVGTHTHVPTADARILDKGTGFVSDIGMCGDYNSIIGMNADEPLTRFVSGMPGKRIQPATGESTISGVIVELDDATGLARRIAPLREGGSLENAFGLH
ncbi:MAG: TIGR00282 family metallophosphoesterase [Albidovulum sp.]|nr:TIGR00282 family metallophosphoesterase [Albidovulum sp.]MDE0531514.1 TIGR00282 family metallophosphoesterase [Albidovulum sp.]